MFKLWLSLTNSNVSNHDQTVLTQNYFVCLPKVILKIAKMQILHMCKLAKYKNRKLCVRIIHVE